MGGERKPVVWVTGASSGIGAAVVSRLAKEGYRILGLARRTDAVPSHPEVATAHLDLEDLNGLPTRLEALAREFQAPDAIVLAAGQGLLGALEESSAAQIRTLLDVNLTANIVAARILVPQMKRRGHGDIVFIGSEAALRGRRRGSVYCAAKFGLRGFAQALREECAGAGLRVSSVHPGTVRTPFFDGLEIEPGPEPEHALTPDDVAESVAHILGLPPSAVVDELWLSPRVAQVRRRKRPKKSPG